MSGEASKDLYFERLGQLAEEMIGVLGKDFAMGALVLAARFIAEGKTLGKRPVERPGAEPTAGGAE